MIKLPAICERFINGSWSAVNWSTRQKGSNLSLRWRRERINRQLSEPCHRWMPYRIRSPDCSALAKFWTTSLFYQSINSSGSKKRWVIMPCQLNLDTISRKLLRSPTVQCSQVFMLPIHRKTTRGTVYPTAWTVRIGIKSYMKSPRFYPTFWRENFRRSRKQRKISTSGRLKLTRRSLFWGRSIMAKLTLGKISSHWRWDSRNSLVWIISTKK